jgi:hypothetical protein
MKSDPLHFSLKMFTPRRTNAVLGDNQGLENVLIFYITKGEKASR